MQMQKEQKMIRVSNAVAAGTTDVNCTGVDTANFESVEFVAAFGTLTATQVTQLKAQQPPIVTGKRGSSSVLFAFA